MRVAVRVDASSQMGLGHLRRCIALASSMRRANMDVLFVWHPSDVDIASFCASYGLRAESLALPTSALQDQASVIENLWLAHTVQDDAQATIATLQAFAPHCVVVDHYGLDGAWQDAVKAALGIPIVVIDDLADRPLSADLLIDHNPATDHQLKYAKVMAHPTTILGGPHFALIDEVYADHERYRFNETVRSIGIFTGGTDPLGFSALAWQSCRQIAGFDGRIEIASTSHNPGLPALLSLTQHDRLVSVSVDQPHLAEFFTRHDLQIGAGGGALWERCCMGAPTIGMVCADNQRISVPELAHLGVLIDIDMLRQAPESRVQALGMLVRDLIDRPETRRQLHLTAQTLVDGQGCSRIVQEIIKIAAHR